MMSGQINHWFAMNLLKKYSGLPILRSYGLLLFVLASCSPVRYIGIETRNPAALTFPPEMRRVLIVDNAVPQQDVPFESVFRQLPDSIQITADSTTFDFCRTLGETIADFAGFDDVRLLEDGYRKDRQPLLAPYLTPDEVGQLCDEHEVDIIVSLDRLLFRLKEYEGYVYGMEAGGIVDVEMSGVLRVYLPGRVSPLTTIALADTITPVPELIIEQNDRGSWNVILSPDQTFLLRESAKFLAEEARIHFIPYWNEDIRWYYVASNAKWKEASAYAAAERWDKALEIWRTLYGQTSSWKQKSRLASNIALGFELTGDLNEALKYAEQSHRLLSGQTGDDHPTVKRQDIYIKVLSHRILEEMRLQLQINN